MLFEDPNLINKLRVIILTKIIKKESITAEKGFINNKQPTNNFNELSIIKIAAVLDCLCSAMFKLFKAFIKLSKMMLVPKIIHNNLICPLS